jgi:hypothetical protein
VVDRVVGLVAVLARETLVVGILADRAELGLSITPVVSVTVSADRGDAMLGTEPVNRICVLFAVVASDTLMCPTLESGTELAFAFTIRVLVAMRADGRRTTRRAFPSNSNLRVAEVAAKAVVGLCPRRAKLCLCVTMVMCVALLCMHSLLCPTLLIFQGTERLVCCITVRRYSR